jgi:sulfonate transport system substrate-binding protein
MKLSRTRAWRGSLAAVLAVGAAVAVPAYASAGSSTASSAAGAKNISLTVGYIGTQGIFTGPEGFAYSKGLLQQWLAPDGVTSVTSAQFANGPLLNAALVGGSVNIGLVGDTPALIARSQGAPTRVINQEELHLASWIITQKSITTLSQLKGQNIARQQASYMDRYLQGLLQEKNLLGKANLVAMLFAQSIPAFNTGAIPALVIIPALAPLITVPYNIVAKSSTTPNLEGTGVTTVTNSLLAADPKLPAAWNAMRVKAIAYAQAHQPAYYAYEAKAEQTTVALAKQYFPLSDNPTQPFTPYGLASLKSTLSFLLETGQAQPFSLSGWEAH